MRTLSLCTGYGGIEMGLSRVLPLDLAYVADIDPGARKVLAHRHPDVPNLGDITAVAWSTLGDIDLICGGTPCQDLSPAGKRAGMSEGTRSNLWVAMREAIAALRPSLVVWENVRGALSAKATSELEQREGLLGVGRPGPYLRAAGRVVGDLASLGYDAQWVGLRAADVGAPHGRFRIFLVAWPAADAGSEHGEQRRLAAPGQAPRGRPLGEPSGRDRAPVALLPTPRATDGTKGGPNQRGSSGDLMLPSAVHLLPTPTVMDSRSSGGNPDTTGTHGTTLTDATVRQPASWGKYAEAITHWERLTRPAPPPTEPTGRNGAARLSPRFSEWMMGLPDGWITDVPGITRPEALRRAGDGVVSQQCAAAVSWLLNVRQEAA